MGEQVRDGESLSKGSLSRLLLERESGCDSFTSGFLWLGFGGHLNDALG